MNALLRRHEGPERPFDEILEALPPSFASSARMTL